MKINKIYVLIFAIMAFLHYFISYSIKYIEFNGNTSLDWSDIGLSLLEGIILTVFILSLVHLKRKKTYIILIVLITVYFYWIHDFPNYQKLKVIHELYDSFVMGVIQSTIMMYIYEKYLTNSNNNKTQEK